MTNLSELSFDEFKGLSLFLKFSNNPEENHNIVKRLTRFIPNMNATQSIILENIVQEIIENNIEEGETEFNKFKNQFPELQFDPEGKQDLTNFEYYEIGLQSVEMLFETAKEKILNKTQNSIDAQIYNAKTLYPLEKLNGKYQYGMRKQVYYKNNPNPVISKEELKTLENNIAEIFPENNSILDKFFFYITTHNPENVKFFIEHFLYRVSIVSKDKKIEAKANKEFYENLKKIS